jgi:hypothetical protein
VTTLPSSSQQNCVDQGLFLGEQEFVNAAETLRLAVTSSGELESVNPRPSPVDADVIADRLVLRDPAANDPETPLESLEGLRKSYCADAERLIAILRGTNAAGSFQARMENAQGTLARPLTAMSSLLLGDQARALEVMLPSMSDVLTSVTAADLAAFVTGLGLLVHQFPAWRTFVAEAWQVKPLSETDEGALRQAALLLDNASDAVIDPALKVAIKSTWETREGLTDSVLGFAATRAIGNVFRAIGRYVLERARGTLAEFNGSFEKSLGSALAKSVVATLFSTAAAALLQLAVGLPFEFGWVIGLGIILAPQK